MGNIPGSCLPAIADYWGPILLMTRGQNVQG